MKLLYAEEHLSCFNYNAGEDSLMRVVHYKGGESSEIHPEHNVLVFVIEGSLFFSYGEFVNVFAKKGNVIVHPAKYNARIQFEADSTILYVRLNMDLSFCDHFSFEMLLKQKDGLKRSKYDNNLHLLTVNDIVEAYLKSLMGYLEDGLRCFYFLELKIKEFLYILRAYYPKEELVPFFSPILNNDLDFSNLVFQVFPKASSVKELAQLLNYSLSGFEKRFKRVFGVSAYQWMQNQKAKNIYHEINCGNKTFTEIGFEYGFSSPSHFNDFCKKYFSDTPGNLRKRHNMKIKQEE